MSKLDDETCWRAVVNRRKDVDGVFFYAVKTTGVSCRPSCPARLPLREERVVLRNREWGQGGGFSPLSAVPAAGCYWTGSGDATMVSLLRYLEAHAGEPISLVQRQLGQAQPLPSAAQL